MLESKRRAAIFLLLAFLLAVAASVLVFDKVKDLNSELGGMTTIYKASESIQARTPIRENQITTEEIPNRFFKDDWHITDKNEILDKVPIVPLSPDEIITTNILRDYSVAMDETKRLIVMYPTEKVQFDQVVEAMDRVDIIVSIKGDNGKPITETFMKDVLVSYAQMEKGDFLGVGLEVSMEDAPKLIHMQNYADKIRILKASGGDMNTATKSDATKEQATKVEENAKDSQETSAKTESSEAKKSEKATTTKTEKETN
jgi:hypothetical protein